MWLMICLLSTAAGRVNREQPLHAIEALIVAGQLERAETKLLALKRPTPSTLFLLGKVQYKRGEYDAATQTFEQVLKAERAVDRRAVTQQWLFLLAERVKPPPPEPPAPPQPAPEPTPQPELARAEVAAAPAVSFSVNVGLLASVAVGSSSLPYVYSGPSMTLPLRDALSLIVSLGFEVAPHDGNWGLVATIGVDWVISRWFSIDLLLFAASDRDPKVPGSVLAGEALYLGGGPALNLLLPGGSFIGVSPSFAFSPGQAQLFFLPELLIGVPIPLG